MRVQLGNFLDLQVCISMSWRHLPLGHFGMFGTVGTNTWRSEIFTLYFVSCCFSCRSRHERGWTNISFVHDHARLKTWFPVIFLVKPCELIHQLAPHHLQGTPFSSHQREQCGWVLWEGWQEDARSHVWPFTPLRLWFSWADSQRWLEHVGT